MLGRKKLLEEIFNPLLLNNFNLYKNPILFQYNILLSFSLKCFDIVVLLMSLIVKWKMVLFVKIPLTMYNITRFSLLLKCTSH